MTPDGMVDRPWWVADWVPHLDDEPSITRLRRVVWLVLLAGVLAFIVEGANTPADPVLVPDPVVEDSGS